ncbi:MAG TPA: FAD-dependent oxidoreductase, partial [Kiloniellales bacterium]|nr:FAD-dependent oxidoreductase [Kiloniellales bacterium]
MSGHGVVIVGAGHAGGRAARALRKQGWSDPIVVLGEEMDPPYERPPLSKAVLSDGADPLVDRIGDEAFYRDNDIDLRLGTRIGSIDPDRR